MLEKLILTLTDAEIDSYPIFHGFYSMLGKRLGYIETSNTRYDCTKISIAKNIQDKCFEYHERLGNDTASIAMNFCMSGPKVDNTLKDNHISIETGYICEGDTVIPFIASTLPGPAEPNDMNRPELDQTAPSTDNKEENIMREYSVRIILSEMTIVTQSTERAEEIAADIFESDAYTKLHHGLCIEDIEIEDYGPSNETEETEL